MNSSYLKGLADRTVIGVGTDEEVMRFDVGSPCSWIYATNHRDGTLAGQQVVRDAQDIDV